MRLEVLDENTAPEDSKGVLRQVKEKVGFIPNVIGVMANVPSFLAGYMQKYESLEKGSLGPKHLQLVLIRFSYLNDCKYCQSAHRPVAKMNGATEEEISYAIGVANQLEDKKLKVLLEVADQIHHERGFVQNSLLQKFAEEGFECTILLELINAYSLKVMSNYLNHIANTPID